MLNKTEVITRFREVGNRVFDDAVKDLQDSAFPAWKLIEKAPNTEAAVLILIFSLFQDIVNLIKKQL